MSFLELDKIREEVFKEKYIVAEFIEYLRWLSEQVNHDPDDDAIQINAGQLWALYCKGVREGIYWTEALEDLKLPVHDDWK